MIIGVFVSVLSDLGQVVEVLRVEFSAVVHFRTVRTHLKSIKILQRNILIKIPNILHWTFPIKTWLRCIGQTFVKNDNIKRVGSFENK